MLSGHHLVLASMCQDVKTDDTTRRAYQNTMDDTDTKQKLSVVFAFETGYPIKDKACWRWLEKHFLLDPSSINLILLHCEQIHSPTLEMCSYRYLDIEDASRYLPYDIWNVLRKRKYPYHEVVLMESTMSISRSILHFMKYDAPRHSLLVLGGGSLHPMIVPQFLMGSVSSDIVSKIDTNPVLLVRTRLFKDISDLRSDTVGAAYLGLIQKEDTRSICIAVDAHHVLSLVRYCLKNLLRKEDTVQILHCASDETASTLTTVNKNIIKMTTRLNHFLNEPEQLDAILLDFSGDPRDKILEHVNVEMAKSIDMLVIGNRTSSKLSMLGSTAQYLLHHANVPVMMIPDSLLQDYSNDEEWQSYPE